MTVVSKDVQYVHCWHCTSSACLPPMSQISHISSSSCSTDADRLLSQFLVAFLQLCVDWNANCVFSEGAIRNYQMVSSLGGLWWLGLHMWRRTISVLKIGIVHIQHHILSVCNQILCASANVYVKEGHLMGLLGYVSAGVLKGCATKFLYCAVRKGIGKLQTHKKRFVY